MKKLYIVLFFMVIANPLLAQTTPNEIIAKANSDFVEKQKTKAWQDEIKERYASVSYIFKDTDPDEALVEIQNLINGGYNSYAHPSGLVGFMDEIKKNRNNSEKVDAIYYYAISTAAPKVNNVIKNPDETIKKVDATINDFEKNAGFTINELELLLEAQGKVKVKPLPSLTK